MWVTGRDVMQMPDEEIPFSFHRQEDREQYVTYDDE
jgi:hypothetical protein